MLICFEGMDGSGKSSVTRGVARAMDIPVIEKPINRLFDITREHSREVVAKIYENYSSYMHSMYYLMGFLSVLEDSRKQNLIMDRGFLSTYYFSFNDECSFLFDAMVQNCGGPDLIIIIYASTEKRIQRIQMRNPNDEDLQKDRIYKEGYDKYFEGINRYNFNYMVVNSDELNEQETLEVSKKIVEMYCDQNLDIEKAHKIFSMDNKEMQKEMTCAELLGYLEQCHLNKKYLKNNGVDLGG